MTKKIIALLTLCFFLIGASVPQAFGASLSLKIESDLKTVEPNTRFSTTLKFKGVTQTKYTAIEIKLQLDDAFELENENAQKDIKDGSISFNTKSNYEENNNNIVLFSSIDISQKFSLSEDSVIATVNLRTKSNPTAGGKAIKVLSCALLDANYNKVTVSASSLSVTVSIPKEYVPPKTTPKPTATPKPSSGKKFSDVESHWAKNEIYLLRDKKIINGISDTVFAPEKSISRAEFIVLVARVLKLSDKVYKNLYFDVKQTDWYAKPIQAANEAGLVSSDENFRPNDTITRQEVTKILIESYKKKKGTNITSASIDTFDDKNTISDWAINYVKQAKGLGLINGMTNTTFAPTANSTRAQAAVILKRLLDKIGG